jgi:hypothetical protein
MELNKFNQSTKYFTRSESGPTYNNPIAGTIEDEPEEVREVRAELKRPPVFETDEPKEAVKEVLRRSPFGKISEPIPIMTSEKANVSLDLFGNPATDKIFDPSIQGQVDVGGGKLGFGIGEDKGSITFRKQFDEGGSIKASSVVAKGLDNLRLARPLLYETGVGAALIGPFDFLSGRPISEILLDIPTLGIAGQSLRAERLRQTVGPEVFDKIQEQRAARSEGIGGIESAMFEDFDVDETPLEEAIQARADREAKVAKTRKIQDVSESNVLNIPKQDPKTGLRNLPSDIEEDFIVSQR